MSPQRLIRPRAHLLATMLVFSVLIFAGALYYRAWRDSQTSDRLCAAIASIIAGSAATLGEPGTPGYTYYRDHPDELDAARDQNQRTLDLLPCVPPIPEEARP